MIQRGFNDTRRSHRGWVGILLGSLLLGSCGSSSESVVPPMPDQPMPDHQIITGLASVEEATVLVLPGLPSEPTQYGVQVSGYVSDPCTELQDPVITLLNQTYVVTLETRRQADLICIQVIDPFEVFVELPQQPIPRLFEAVLVNGVEALF